MPADLLDVYLRAFRSDNEFPTPNSRSPGKLRKMLNSVRLDTSGLRITGRPASATAFVHYKNKTKCRLLLNATKINAVNDRRPPRIKLPSLQLLAGRLARPGGRRLWMAKLDLTNAYWSIRLPGAWRRVFVVRVHGKGWRYTRLPFGWKYSPEVCHRLVRTLVRSAVQGLPAVTDVYLDDILVSASSASLVSRALRNIVHKLRSAGFIISPKSETTPSQRLSFIGKRIDSRQGSIANSPEAVAAALRIWLRGLGRGGISPHELSRLLGRLQWLARPGVGAAPFLAGAYRQIGAGRSHFTRALARSLGTVIAFSAPPLRISRRHYRRTSVFFSDAAEAPGGFRVGVVGSPECYRTRMCPPWITSLQQAELYAAYWATPIVVYKGAQSVAVGVDNDAARALLSALSPSVACVSQQRMLRRMFWLRAWSHVEPSFFRVASALNPADPLSRIHDFPRWTHVTAAAERRRKSWGMNPGQFGGFSPSRPSARVAG